MADKLKVTLVKSVIGRIPNHRKTVEALGLKKTSVATPFLTMRQQEE